MFKLSNFEIRCKNRSAYLPLSRKTMFGFVRFFNKHLDNQIGVDSFAIASKVMEIVFSLPKILLNLLLRSLTVL